MTHSKLLPGMGTVTGRGRILKMPSLSTQNSQMPQQPLAVMASVETATVVSAKSADFSHRHDTLGPIV